MIYKDLIVNTDNRPIKVLLKLPDGVYDSSRILLFSFALDRHTSLQTAPYCKAADYLIALGHNSLSFDIPNHGEYIDEFGEGINGLRDAFPDRFQLQPIGLVFAGCC
jgi:hypothetical protein